MASLVVVEVLSVSVLSWVYYQQPGHERLWAFSRLYDRRSLMAGLTACRFTERNSLTGQCGSSVPLRLIPVSRVHWWWWRGSSAAAARGHIYRKVARRICRVQPSNSSILSHCTLCQYAYRIQTLSAIQFRTIFAFHAKKIMTTPL